MTTPTPQNYLLLDKDDTLGNFPHPGFFPDVIHFLKQQHQLDRKLVIATYAPVKHTAENLLPLADILHASICREHFRCQDKQGTNIKDFYINVSGSVRGRLSSLLKALPKIGISMLSNRHLGRLL